ncbi:RNA methyltransferase [Actinokineospora sp. NBRC 105648]|uniref:TrmH family RNA methyltransferase n=1 Tax=Actinokineospora sp. NBRC 105648 TaxID=3032206 RepID=UPI00249FD884|nr:RNA methyltransferase [Actinokineospora sp. NBRC 105648]GLZ42586.1 tRNA/rRNA methyltransferase [Actinokineospora sp. NBRC 105648]
MAQVIEVGDPADPRLDDFRDLSTADRRPDRPGGRGLVIAEGVVVVERLLASPYPVRALLGVRRRVEALAPLLERHDVPAYVATAEVMAEAVGFHLNRGVLACADRAPAPDPLDFVAHARTLAVLEGVGDHENLGALFRNAAALGVDGVLLGPGCSDPLYRRSVRVSMGHVLAVPFAPLEPWPDGLKWLRDSGFSILALTPRADSVPLSEAARGCERVAVLLGSEGPGLTSDAIAAADHAVRIPMARGVDSLNVATAAAVAFYALGVGERETGGTTRQG